MQQGIIKKVFSKPWTDKFKGTEITLYSFLLEGDDKFYGCGSAPVNASPGDSVEFTMKGKNVDMSTFKVVDKVQVAAAPQPVQTGGSKKTDWAKKDDYWAAKEARDIEKEERFRAVNEPRMALSVATEAAAQVVCAALAADVLGFGTAAKSKRLDMLTGYVKDVATDLANFITNAPEIVEYNDES